MVATMGMETTALGMDLAASNSVELQAHALDPLAHYLVLSHGHLKADQDLLRLLAHNTTHGVPELLRIGSGG